MKDNNQYLSEIYEKYRTNKKSNIKKLKFFLAIIMVIIVISSITYAGIFRMKNKNKVEITPSFKSSIYNTNSNKVWIASFQLAWNELMNRLGGNVEFEENSAIVEELNQSVFTKDMLDSQSYYIKVEKYYEGLEDDIQNDLKQKFNIQNSEILFNNVQNGDYVIYAMLNKNFEFNEPFPDVGVHTFGNSDNSVKYFGVNPQTKESTAKQITILFYNDQDDFAIKINTKGNDELILYKNRDINNFYEAYSKINQESNKYTGEKEINTKKDSVKIPFIDIDATINYDELCNKKIKNLNNGIGKAIQNINFKLNNYGGNIYSEAVIETYESMLTKTKEFNFNDRFFLFIKEKEQEIPYFAILVDNDDVLVKQ